MLPVCTGWQGTMQIGGGLSHLEPPESQPFQVEVRIFPDCVWSANMILSKGYVDQIRCCQCARDAKEPGR